MPSFSGGSQTRAGLRPAAKLRRYLMTRRTLLAVALPLVLAGAALAAPPAVKPRPGFRAELVASEPLIESPVAFDWGPDCPLGLDNKGKPGGRVVCLEDADGDGRYDKSTIFLDGLLFPTGVITWGKGVIVTCAPEIFYAED